MSRALVSDSESVLMSSSSESWMQGGLRLGACNHFHAGLFFFGWPWGWHLGCMNGGFVPVWEALDIGFGVALAPISLISSLFMLTSKIICDNRYSNKSWCIVRQGMFPMAPKQVILRSKHLHWCRAWSFEGAHIMCCPLWTGLTWIHLFYVVHTVVFNCILVRTSI